MKTAKRFAVLLLAINMLFLSGCWNYREVDNMSMIGGIAIDKGKDGFKYHITYEFLDLSNGQINSKLLETDGDTLFDCARNAIGKSQKKLFFSDCKVVIINNEIASEGIAPILDWMLRDSEPRINLNLLISKEKTAAEILEQKPVTNQLTSLEIWNMLEQNTASLGETPNVKLYQANNILASEGISLNLPSIKVSAGKEKTTELDGTAVFKKDKLVGYLNRNESKYFLFSTGKIKGGLLVTSPKNDKNFITLEISESSAKITPVIKDDNVTMEIEIKVKAALGEEQTPIDYTSVSGIQAAERSAEKTLQYGVNEVIKKCQSQYDTDIFGFGSCIHLNKPEFWTKEKANWDDTFRTLKYSITTDVDITNTATTKSKVKVGD
jgi:spore germination protein KC